ncbi:tetratricopeptide repeat protein [Crenobacter sp. SG2303]|uniref:Tetratricopeptide repeat protein n=1 Tax=Crenobacter oryzisoli TaxID=3056844 RepID=A0ABT7XV28_9NEIS|nr:MULTISPECIES: tetratricopeptide repeat protein [unclassified Crenobacter]MDN0077655.1 tetratricopeptide repeat protein [Crenobacter sp. SG2303]MDN0081741.1 tetratricopeptide repeat protein [Crenobacter sp. SG2305]
MTTPMLDALMKLVGTPRDGAMLRFGIANELMHQQRLSEAEAYLREALVMQPDYSAAWKLLGKVLVAAQKPDAARLVYQDGIAVAELKGDLQAAKEMGVFLRRLDKAAG